VPLGLALAAAVLLGACGGEPPPAPGGVAPPPARIVSLAPSITEIVYGLGAGNRLVGVCAHCDHPAPAAQLPRVGGYLAPSVEAVLAARPDLVIVVPSPGNREAVRAIERAGARVLVVADRTLADLWASIRRVAEALGTPAEGEALAARIRAELEAVRARVAGRPTRRVLLVVGHRPLVVAGGGTLQCELVALAGGVNVAADAGQAFPLFPLEAVVERAPEVIVDAAMGSEAGGRAVFAELSAVPAVANGRIVPLAPDALFRAGPRVGAGALALARAVHPEAFDTAPPAR
jgi:iron complex transport system substrate-binding protein